MLRLRVQHDTRKKAASPLCHSNSGVKLSPEAKHLGFENHVISVCQLVLTLCLPRVRMLWIAPVCLAG